MLNQPEALVAQFSYTCDEQQSNAAGTSRIGCYSDNLANSLPRSRSISSYDSEKTYTDPMLYSSKAVEELSGLMMLADVCEEEQQDSNSINSYQHVDGNVIKDVAGTFKRRKQLLDEADKRWSTGDRYGYNHKDDIDCEFICKLCDKTFTSYQALGGHMSNHNRLKINFADHDHDRFSSQYNNEQRPHPHPVVNVYRCSNCDRTFSSFQALGGHRSSHCKDVNNNNNNNNSNTNNSADNNDPAEPRQDEVHRCHVCKKAFTSYRSLGGHVSSHSKNKNNNNVDQDQSNSADMSTSRAEDKNERQKLYQTVPHQCKLCSKTFPTGRALGGHQMLHYKGPTQAPGKSSQQSSAHKHLGINLNEIPSMEDEDGIYEPSVILKLN